MPAMKPVTIFDVCDPGCTVILDDTGAETNNHSVSRKDFRTAVRSAKKNRKIGARIVTNEGDNYKVVYSLKEISIGCFCFAGKNRTALLKWAGLKAR